MGLPWRLYNEPPFRRARMRLQSLRAPEPHGVLDQRPSPSAVVDAEPGAHTQERVDRQSSAESGGTARFSGGLSVYTFLRVRTWLRIDDRARARPLIEDAIWLSRAEGLEAHARAAERRLVAE